MGQRAHGSGLADTNAAHAGIRARSHTLAHAHTRSCTHTFAHSSQHALFALLAVWQNCADAHIVANAFERSANVGQKGTFTILLVSLLSFAIIGAAGAVWCFGWLDPERDLRKPRAYRSEEMASPHHHSPSASGSECEGASPVRL
eukprot:53131-Prymnesium_polylepis.3